MFNFVCFKSQLFEDLSYMVNPEVGKNSVPLFDLSQPLTQNLPYSL